MTQLKNIALFQNVIFVYIKDLKYIGYFPQFENESDSFETVQLGIKNIHYMFAWLWLLFWHLKHFVLFCKTSVEV